MKNIKFTDKGGNLVKVCLCAPRTLSPLCSHPLSHPPTLAPRVNPTHPQAGNPVSYATLTELPKLPLAAIDAIDALTFTTIDSKLHSYKKSGIFWG